MGYVKYVRSMSFNSPKTKVVKRDGLWKVYTGGMWQGTFSDWRKAIRLAQDGVIEW